MVFQSTPSRRTVTHASFPPFVEHFISIHTVPKDSDTDQKGQEWFIGYFNPHRPEGQWPKPIDADTTPSAFQSTPSRRTVTVSAGLHQIRQGISIHTVPKDSDGQCRITSNTAGNFNPHRPEGQWRYRYRIYQEELIFQSTPSRRTVTWISQYIVLRIAISIHTVPKDSDKGRQPLDRAF